MRERLEDLFFVSVAFVFAGFGAWSLWYTEGVRMQNRELRHHLSQLCEYIEGLPKRHRAVFDVCLQKTNRR